MDCVRGPIPRKDQITNLPLDTGKTRGNRPAWTPLESTGQTERNIFSQSKESAVEEAARSEIVLLKPNRCQKTDMKDRGSNLDTRPSIPDRCDDCDTQMLTGHHSVMTEDMEVEPGPIRMYPVKMDGAPIYGENVPLRPMTFLDVPATRLTGGFLKLAEEARHSEGVDDQPPGMNLVHSQHSGRTGRTLILEIEDSFPGSGSEESRGSRTSTEVIPNCNIVKPVIRLGPVGQDIRGLGYTNVMAKPDPVGPYKDRDLSVSRMTDGPAGLVRIRHPEGSYEDRDISVSPVTDGPAGLVRTRRPVGSYEDRDISVSPVTDGPAGLVRTRRPVGSDEDRDVSVPPVTDGPAGLVRTRRPVGQYEDRDISVSPVTDGPAGLVRTRRPVGAEMLPALQDGVRPLAGGLLDQVPDPCVLTSPTRSESAVKKECLHPVITTEGEALRGRMCPSVVMKTTEPSKVKCSPEVLTNTAEGSLVSSSVIPDPVIRTGSDDRTNNMKLDRIKGQTDLSAVSPSSDSGVHSVDEEWDCMSTYSGESDSIQSVKTVYGGVCQTDRPVVKLRTMDSRGVMDTLEGQYGDQDSVPSVSTNGHNSDIADMGDFSDEEEGQWEEVEPSKDVQTDVRTECVVNDHMSFLSTIGHNSDIADMGDFSDEENEQWDEVETSEDVQTEVRTGGVDNNASNSCARSELPQKPIVVIPHYMEIHDEDYWTNFRFQAKQAFKLDNVALAASDFPIAVKELVVKSRVTMQDINDRAERQYEEEEEWEAAGETVKPSFFYNDTDRLEDFSIPISNWCRRGSPIVDEEPTKTVFGPVTGPEERRNRYKIADIGDYFRDPDARARFELSQAKSAITMGYTYFNDTGDDGATGMGESMTGDTGAEENEYIRVSMISVDEHRTVQSDFKHDSLGIRDCALPECATQPMLAAYEDSTLCVRESFPSMTTSCFGLCGLTNQFHHADFEWCVKCVNRLLWGFIVSCVVSIVGRGIDVFITGCDVLVSIGARLDGLITPGDAMRLCLWRTEDFKDMLHIVMCDHWTGLIRLDIPWGEDNRPVRATRAAVDTGSIRAGRRFGCWDRPVRSDDWLDVRPMDGGPVGTDVWIKYIGDSLWGYQSTDAAPLTGVHDTNITLQIDSDCFARLCSTRIVYLTVRINWSLEEVVQCGVISSLTQTMDGAALANDRSGITFTADLCVPWDAPEAVIEMNSPDLISLETIPDKVGLFGRRKEAAMSRIMSARDCRGVRFVVPDVRLVDRGFHDVTVIDMEDDREPTIVLKDMTRLRELWPVEVFEHMRCHQQDLERLRKSAKKDYVQTRPMLCRFCGKVIRVDMYRHVARLHLDLVQLWRCPIAWCTTWKGSPQDCLEHVRSGHDAPWVEKTASIEKYAPPWTVPRQLWLDSLRIEHSGISTDMLLFSEVGMPLTQHYRVYKGGLPHAVFRTDYLQRLRALLPSPGGSDEPSVTGYGSTPTSVRRQRRMSKPTRLFPGSDVNVPILTEQNPAEMVGESVFDCRPPGLPVSIPLSGFSPAMISGACDCTSHQQLEESSRSIMNMDTNEISISGIIGFPWNDSGTDVEDELPSPVASPDPIMSPPLAPADSSDPFGRGVNYDLDLADVFRDATVLPSLVTPLEDTEATVAGTAATYDPPVEPVGTSSPARDSAAEESFLQLLREPRELLTVTSTDSPIGPDTSTPAVTPETVTATRTVPPTSPVMPAGGVPDAMGPDLSREGPFDACDVVPDAGQSPLILDGMEGCQYRMTSYDERQPSSNTDSSYGIHMHDPRVIEYMGAPESARLMGRTPEYWLQHMGRERTIQAALRLHHDASLIMTNIQILSQLATSFSRAASEVMRTIHERKPFPTEAVDLVTPGRPVRRAAHYMAAMGLWRPTSAPVFPGPVAASSCNSCMACDDCFPDGGK